jgi:hypothetical protein
MLFANLLFAVALTIVWPLGMLGLLSACAWLERRTLIPEEIVPRRIRRMDRKTPEAVEAMVFEETADVVAEYWSSPSHPFLGTKPSPNGRAPAGNPDEPAAEHQPHPPQPPEPSRVIADRAARLAARLPPRGRHERR